MEATIINDSRKTQRNCQNCGKEITEGNAKRVFCSNSCRSVNHENVKKREDLLQAQTLEEQRATIGRLTDAPVQRKEAVRVVNPEWQLANQGYSAQKELCSSLTSQLTARQSEIQDARSGSRGAYYGAAVAVALVLYFCGSSLRRPKGSADWYRLYSWVAVVPHCHECGRLLARQNDPCAVSHSQRAGQC